MAVKMPLPPHIPYGIVSFLAGVLPRSTGKTPIQPHSIVVYFHRVFVTISMR